MNLQMETGIAESYHSGSQKVRVMTEEWAGKNIYCPCCGYEKIEHFKNNCPVADFFCPYCQEEYELKSKAGAIGGVIADGAYDTMISRIKGDTGVPGTWILQKSIILVVICVFRRKNY